MDIFVRALPEQCTDRELTELLRGYLKSLGNPAFLVRKLKNKSCAILTIANHHAAKQFLEVHGSSQDSKAQPAKPLSFQSKLIYCSAAKNPPDPFVLQGLQQQQQERRGRGRKADDFKQDTTHYVRSGPRTHTFGIESVACGQWEYEKDRLAFLPTYSDIRHGSLVLGGKSLVIFLVKTGIQQQYARIDIDYSAIDSIITGKIRDRSTVSFTLLQAPTFSTFDLAGDQNSENDPDAMSPVRASNQIDNTMSRLALNALHNNTAMQMPRSARRVRTCGLNMNHQVVAGSCFVYQVILVDSNDINLIHHTLDNTHGTPSWLWNPTTERRRYDFYTELHNLIAELGNPEGAGTMPFGVLYQLQRLAQNGFLSPKAVKELLLPVKKLCKQFNRVALAEGIRELSKILPQPGPDVEAKTFLVANLIEVIKKKATLFKLQTSEYAHADRYPHLIMVHKVTITPTGTHLEGPDVDVQNRVTRKFPNYADYFMRVTFADEDGQPTHLPHYIDGSEIYQKRFASVLNGAINVAGRHFVILGWSHSSLRTRQCWFAAPFIQGRQLVSARQVIRELGDFSAIRCPAKCAARIGQTFSDSTDTITIAPNLVKFIPDIERNDRVFSDGVGQISLDILQKIWKEFRQSRRSHATIVQIRYQGSKGTLALNPKLEGESLQLRKSMDKFPGSRDATLDICGASYNKLPMYMNRQLIKILEDMGSRPTAFIDLQDQAVRKLSFITTHPINAARFLEQNMIGKAARVSRLIRSMNSINLNFYDDKFLRDVVEMAAIMQVRDLKHQREIYVPTRDFDGKLEVLTGKCMVTRSPALHPGDVQLVEAVTVPTDSPLYKLHNCVVFSQQGERDLPSMLSGGDLDGDLYNVIFEPSIWPKKQFCPADYSRVPAVDIGRAVEVKDMTDFFLTFMETDQLGYICNTHLQVADQMADGPLNPSCLKLAEMASTAVDFSKTGVPVDMSQMPKDFIRRAKPDFMASAPRLIMQGGISIENLPMIDDNENDPVRALDPSSRPTTYYRSQKVLGHLYRNIDETKFLQDIQRHRGYPSDQSLMKRVWSYANRETKTIQWAHQLETARNIKAAYESHLIDTLYQFAPNPRDPLSELEVFTGTILGKSGGMPNGRVRQYNTDMKAKADRDVQYIIEWILRDSPRDESGSDDGYEENYYPDDDDDDQYNYMSTMADGGDVLGAGYAEDYMGEEFEEMPMGGTDEALERSLACFYVAVNEPAKVVPKLGALKSFAYVAAAVCLQEVVKFREMAAQSWG